MKFLKKDKYIIILVACTVVFMLAMGIVSIFTTKGILKRNADQNLKLQCENICLEFNDTLHSIEQTVNTLSSSAVYHIHNFKEFKTNPDAIDTYAESLRDIILYSAENTKGAISIYLRFNPEFTEPTSGLFFVKDDNTGKFNEVPTTDFSTTFAEDAPWYYEPVKAGEPIWMEPYENKNIGYYVISYVVPIYHEGEVLGVIGMDISYDYIKNLILSYNAFESGYAFLLNKDAEVIVHKSYDVYDAFADIENSKDFLRVIQSENMSGQYEVGDGTKTCVCTETRNNMIIGITAPDSEIYSDYHKQTYTFAVMTLIALIIITVIASIIVKKIYRLSEIDELSGIYNRKYFINIYKSLDENKLKTSSLFLFDIDFFKQVNDTYGHNVGDEAIMYVCETAREILGKNNLIARWGGDEFIGLVNSEQAEELLERLRKKIDNTQDKSFGKISLSIGATPINGRKNLRTVCEKADQALYTSKSNGRNCVTIYTEK